MRYGVPGPSPRGRGSPEPRVEDRLAVRSIPAWAGEPYHPPSETSRPRVHPRVGGGAINTVSGRWAHGGPSPRGRGSLVQIAACLAQHGSIPAWAGEPRTGRCATSTSRVHPRVGGGAQSLRFVVDVFRGPSPRGRGSRCGGGAALSHQRSIPAWAGEPARRLQCPRRARVHPRVGGGARWISGETSRLRGPSPRGRGSRNRRRDGRTGLRSIPAWAGEPTRCSRSKARTRVHPRVGGGAVAASMMDTCGEGPSPRGRGSRHRHPVFAADVGSIPAWAGEPPRSTGSTPTSGVHPRVGGGAITGVWGIP